jgi:hypothetical protein
MLVTHRLHSTAYFSLNPLIAGYSGSSEPCSIQLAHNGRGKSGIFVATLCQRRIDIAVSAGKLVKLRAIVNFARVD